MTAGVCFIAVAALACMGCAGPVILRSSCDARVATARALAEGQVSWAELRASFLQINLDACRSGRGGL